MTRARSIRAVRMKLAQCAKARHAVGRLLFKQSRAVSAALCPLTAFIVLEMVSEGFLPRNSMVRPTWRGTGDGASAQRRNAAAQNDQARLCRPNDGRQGRVHDDRQEIRSRLLG